MVSGRRNTYGMNSSVRRPRRRRGSGRFLMLLAILAAAAFLVYSRTFVLKEIVIVGNNEKSASEIAGLTKLSLGMNIFRIDEETVRRNLSADAYVEVLDVRKELPDSLVVSIRERVPAAAVNCAGVIMLIDENGYILERLSSPPQEDIVVISGMDVSVNTQGDRIESGIIGQMKTIQNLLSVMRESETDKLVSELNVANLDNLYLVSKTGIQVLLGDESKLEEKIMWMQAVLERLTQDGITSGVLDVSSGKNAVFADR